MTAGFDSQQEGASGPMRPREGAFYARTGVRCGGSEHADDEQRPDEDPTTTVLSSLRMMRT